MSESLWFGSPESLDTYYRYLAYLENNADASMFVDEEGEDDEDELSSALQIEGSTGIININGSLIPNSNFWTRIFGMTGYDEIALAGQQASEMDEIENVVMSINSGGGAVMGLDSVSEVLKQVAKIKPMYSNTEGAMHSAAYWLGSIGQNISSTKMGNMGSIGTVITHRSVHRALKERGIDVTIIRSGKEKALGHPAEKLSDKAKAKLQAEADKFTGFFREHVESQRGTALGGWNDWGEGKTFFAEDAIRVGLSDRIENLSQLVSRLNREATHETTTEIPDMKKKVILQDAQAEAQLAAGVPLKEVGHQEAPAASAEEVAAAATAAAAAASAAEKTPAKAAASEGDEGARATASESSEGPAADSESALVAHLKSELTGVRTDLSETQAKLVTAESGLADATAHLPEMSKIVAASIQHMQVALGQAPMAGLNELPPGTLVTQHTATRTTFQETFHVGQQSAATPVEDKPKAVVTPLDLGIMPKPESK